MTLPFACACSLPFFAKVVPFLVVPHRLPPRSGAIAASPAEARPACEQRTQPRWCAAKTSTADILSSRHPRQTSPPPPPSRRFVGSPSGVQASLDQSRRISPAAVPSRLPPPVSHKRAHTALCLTSCSFLRCPTGCPWGCQRQPGRADRRADRRADLQPYCQPGRHVHLGPHSSWRPQPAVTTSPHKPTPNPQHTHIVALPCLHTSKGRCVSTVVVKRRLVVPAGGRIVAVAVASSPGCLTRVCVVRLVPSWLPAHRQEVKALPATILSLPFHCPFTACHTFRRCGSGRRSSGWGAGGLGWTGRCGGQLVSRRAGRQPE